LFNDAGHVVMTLAGFFLRTCRATVVLYQGAASAVPIAAPCSQNNLAQGRSAGGAE
jgi:hypothetical protein